ALRLHLLRDFPEREHLHVVARDASRRAARRHSAGLGAPFTALRPSAAGIRISWRDIPAADRAAGVSCSKLWTEDAADDPAGPNGLRRYSRWLYSAAPVRGLSTGPAHQADGPCAAKKGSTFAWNASG